MDEETAEGSAHLETFLERGILRNTKTFSAVFDRIFDKYERDFPEDEVGGKVINFYGDDSDSQIEAIFGGDNAHLGSKYRPILIVDDNRSESDPEDAALSALLHERVVKVKQEIDWDQEEQKLREKRREKELRQQDSSSDESDSAEYAEVRWHQRRNGRGRWAWPPLSLSSAGRTTCNIHNHGGGSQQLLMIDPNSQIVTTVSSQSVHSESETEDPTDHNDTIFYPQHDNVSRTRNSTQLLSSMLDTTSTCTMESDSYESSDTICAVPTDVLVRNHESFQNNRSFHQPETVTSPVNDIVLAGSPTVDGTSSCERDGNFLLSVNLTTEPGRPSANSLCERTLESPHNTTKNKCTLWSERPPYALTSYESQATPTNQYTDTTTEDPASSNRQQYLPGRVEPFNIVAKIKIESQSSTEEELLSGIASESEDSWRFPTRQSFSRGWSSATMTRQKQGESDTIEVKSQSESELEVRPRPSQTRLEDERSEESLMSGYESGYVYESNLTTTQSNVAPHVSTLPSSHFGSSSSTPPPIDDNIVTPPPGDDNFVTLPSTNDGQEVANSMQERSLTVIPESLGPQKESTSLKCTTTNLHTRTPMTEAQMVEGRLSVQDTANASLIASAGTTERAAFVEIVKQERELCCQQKMHLPSATQLSMVESTVIVKHEFNIQDSDCLCQQNEGVITKEVKAQLLGVSEELSHQTSMDPYPVVNVSTSNCTAASNAHELPSAHIVPPTEPSIPNDSTADSAEDMQHLNPQPDQTTSATCVSDTAMKVTAEEWNDIEKQEVNQQPCSDPATSYGTAGEASSSNVCTPMRTVPVEMLQVHHCRPDNPSKVEETMANCTCCSQPQLTRPGGGACSHTHSPLSPPTSSSCISNTCHTCTHEHCRRCPQVTSLRIPLISHTSPPHGGRNHTHSLSCCSSHILNTSTTPATQLQAMHLTWSLPSLSSHVSNASASPTPPPPAPVTLIHGRSHTHSHSLTPEGNHTHSISSCSSHILTTPSPSNKNHCPCCSPFVQLPGNRNLLSSHLLMPSPQQMSVNLKRIRDDDEELSVTSSGSKIDSPPAKRHCL